jgi:hypothetical protein
LVARAGLPAAAPADWSVFDLRSDLYGDKHRARLAAAYAGRFRLTPSQRTALLGLDTQALVKLGVHPLVAFLANMQVERQRKT